MCVLLKDAATYLASIIFECASSTGGMIPTGEFTVLGKKKHASATASITNTSRSGRGSNPGLCGQKLAINGLNHNTAFKLWEVHLKMFLHHEDVRNS